MSTTTWSLPGDRPACVQALNHLKLGVSPWKGLEFLSVGLDSQKRLIKQALDDARRMETRTLMVELAYGAGKTHLLRLARELAERMGFVVAHITHDPLRNVAFNKPMNVFAEIVTDLCREYPHASYRRLLEELAPAHLYHQQARYRSGIPQRLAELGAALAPPDRRGLLVLVDELEGLTTSSMPNRRSREISYEVLATLMSRYSGPEGCVLIMAVTPDTLDRFESDWHDPWRTNRPSQRFPRSDIGFIPGGVLTVADALTLHARIDAVHGVARSRQPADPAGLSRIGNDLVRMCQHTDGSLHYRTFIQACVTDFDVRYAHGIDGGAYSTGLSVLLPTARLVARPPSAQPQATAPAGVPPARPIPAVPQIPAVARPTIPAFTVPGPNGPPATALRPSGADQGPDGNDPTHSDRLTAYLAMVFPDRSSHEDFAKNTDARCRELAAGFPHVFHGIHPEAVRGFLQNMLEDNGRFRVPSRRGGLFVTGEIDNMRRTSVNMSARLTSPAETVPSSGDPAHSRTQGGARDQKLLDRAWDIDRLWLDLARTYPAHSTVLDVAGTIETKCAELVIAFPHLFQDVALSDVKGFLHTVLIADGAFRTPRQRHTRVIDNALNVITRAVRDSAAPSPGWLPGHDPFMIREHMGMVTGASVVYLSPVGIRMNATIVAVDFAERTARVRLTRFSFEFTVGLHLLSVTR